MTIYKQIIRSCCNCLGMTIRKIRCEYRKKACTSSIPTIGKSSNFPSLDCTLHSRAVLCYNMSFYKRHASLFLYPRVNSLFKLRTKKQKKTFHFLQHQDQKINLITKSLFWLTICAKIENPEIFS